MDRETYIAGETAWYKAYLYSDYQPDTISSVLYVELANGNGDIITRSVVPVLFGTASGHVDIPDSLFAGYYQLRSYSPTMLNIDSGFINTQRVFIYGRKPEKPVITEKKIRLEFFPEGGTLFTGVSNFIAYKATDEKGLPINVSATLLNERNETVTTFSSYHDGMGIIELTPMPGEKYVVMVDQDANATRFPLPESTKKGLGLSIIPHPQGYFFEVKQQGNDPSFRAAYMVGHMQHHTVFRQDFKNRNDEIQGLINTQKLSSGILQVTFFNADHQPLAERICFVNNKEYLLTGKIVADTLDFSRRGKNKLSIQLQDTIRGNFSVSIIDAAFAHNRSREANILSGLLLTGDLKGYIHQPAYYFSSDHDSVKTALDLVMMTNGWRRFRWEELASRSKQALRYKDPSFITLAGKITLRDTKRPFDEKPVLLLLVAADSTQSVHLTQTDKQGNFHLDSMLFFGRSRLMFADTRGKKSQFLDAHLSGDSITRQFALPSSVHPRETWQSSTEQSRFDEDYEKIYSEKGFLMQGVTVKAVKKKSQLEELEERYTSGSFSTDSRKVFDLVNTDDAKYYNTISDFLRAKGFALGTRTMPTISSLGEYQTEIYVDEFLTDEDLLETIPLNRVAMIKIYSTFSGSWGGGPGGAIAIYTKKDEDVWSASDARTSIKIYNGYSVIKEFYAPDYSFQPQTAEPDNRITLAWRPNIKVNNVNPRIPLRFYNNDRTKSYKIIVEGMTYDGKMLMIEQTISPGR